ncbi:MAG: AEC family transporter [Oscillochloridaceae bacterium]|nr:AEC family transporter [Chloroflexaceae bacterium]MDW8390615.1 AEC family transporter [Oscillochloridaceae bacterium]
MIRVLLEVLLPVALVAAAGMVLRRRMALDQATLNRVVIYGLSPALIFTSLVTTDLSGAGAARMLALALGVLLAMGLISWATGRLLGLRGGSLSALVLVGAFMNSGNYGLPAARFAFGQEGLSLALFYFIVQAIMGQTVGVAVGAAGNARSGAGAPLEVTQRVLRMPQVYATAAALLVRATGFDPTAAGGAVLGLFRGVTLLGEAALPMMLIVLGAQLGSGIAREDPWLVGLACALRLAVSPLVAYGLGLMLGLQGMSLAVGVMLSGMPAAVHTTITAIEFEARPSLVVAVVVASSALSLVSLAVLLAVLPG